MMNNREPVYISLTSISSNQDRLYQTLTSIISQSIRPDKIFLFLSEEPYILDKGFKDKKITYGNLLNLIKNNSIIEIKWTKNIGSYRKLLPLLKEKWEEDCIIITIDDDTVYHNKLIENLIIDYNNHKCVIGYRGFLPLFQNINDFDYFRKRTNIDNSSLYNFLTGKGGILYKPQFFHKTKDLVFDESIYMNTCDKQDDIWFYIIRIINNINCYIGKYDWLKKEITGKGLYEHFNKTKYANTNAFKNTINVLQERGYININHKIEY